MAARDLTSEDLDRILALQDRAPEEVLAELTRLREIRRSDAEGPASPSLADAVATASGVAIPVWEAAGHELLDALTPRNHDARRSLRESAIHDVGALARVGVEDVSLVADFPIVTATYGFSREEFAPNRARLNAFPPDRSHGGRTPVYVDEVGADALVLELDHERVLRWLRANGYSPMLPGGKEAAAARSGFFVQVLAGINLRETIPASEPVARLVFGLLHTLTHAAIRQAGLLCGLDRTSLSEYLLPRSLSSAIYCNHRFGATIGALTALFESSLAEWFALVEGGGRCIYDPVCGELGANCHACTQLPETSCAFYNLNLSRAFLFGGRDEVAGEVSVGYLDRRLNQDDS
jgi:hypothetical protein